MNINYYKSLPMKVLHLAIFLTIIACFCLPSVQSLNMLPLCSVCAQDDGTNCQLCATCFRYAALTAGYCNCKSGFYINDTDPTNSYCDRCHVSCKTCFGPLQSNCLTCATNFTFVAIGSSCSPPNTTIQQTLLQQYSFYGFTKLSTWSFSNSPGTTTIQCGIRTLLGGVGVISGGSYLQTTISGLSYHFQLRVMVGFYIFNDGSASTSPWIVVDSVNKTFASGESQTTPATICSVSGTSYNYIHQNIDAVFSHSATTTTTTIQLGLTSGSYNFAIRQFYLIIQLCTQANCSTCSGNNANQCLTCVDTRRAANLMYNSAYINNGTCLCNNNYYQEPYAGTCVDPCPSVPIQYYGDNSTRYCVQNCPINSFAYDDVYRCWIDCPTTSLAGNLLFRDNTTWKCVTTCSSAVPYAYTVDRNCYANCPSGTFASNATDRRCLATCPNNANFKLWAYTNTNGIRSCVANCPVGYWADPHTLTCVTNCSFSGFPYKDNSTGANLCVTTCPGPNYFGENSTYYCILTCPDGYYGQNTQMCVTQCGSPRWGLTDENRKCVSYCPDKYWGEPTTRTCINLTTDCNPLFADNYTRTCVAALSCSLGYFADNATYMCVPYCPNNTFSDPNTKICNQYCVSPYFRDFGINQCVSTCVTANTYADVSSNRTCVTSCNSSGTTPWADDSLRTCVSVCNSSISIYLSDNTTWKCVYYCPAGYYADTTTAIPKCVPVCPNNYYADNSTGTGICVAKCSSYPSKFGDATGGINLCVTICSPGLFGNPTGNRLCTNSCPGIYYAQNDSSRLCVTKCKDNTYGYNNLCLTDPHNCPANYFGDSSTNLCVNPCPSILGTFGDPVSRLCVRSCPNNPSTGPSTYFADISIRQCVLVCNASYSTGLFGNNNTRTCQTKCLDYNSYGQPLISRLCVSNCYTTSNNYANNATKLCVTSINCQTNYFGQNTTQMCVESCPNGSFAYQSALVKLCIDQCPLQVGGTNYFGDITTGLYVCVTNCPALPPRYADPTTKLCVQTCPPNYYSQDTGRTCVTLCPPGTFSYQPTRKCLQNCPSGYFGDNIATVRKCHNASSLCGATRFGDPYKNLCVSVCSDPISTPVNLFGSWPDCVSFCPNGTYGNSDSLRLCVTDCPLNTSVNLFGDPTTHTCVSHCITLLTWADSQTRDCQSICSDLPIPTYSQNFGMTCVISLSCPISPSLTFGDNSTRQCSSNCSNGKYGDPTSRNCVLQCPNNIQTGTSTYYGDKSTGVNLCVVICPQNPVLFGQNSTNLCVSECPQPLYGDQTGNRSCLSQCPIVNSVYYYAQNISRICVQVCISGTWGLTSTRQCVEDPFNCGTQWANNNTNMCVTTCPINSNLYGDPTSKFCVPFCPSTYFSDDSQRLCVQTCPSSYGAFGTFGNNNTRACQQYCTQLNAYADPQTSNRYCVFKNCSQTPNQAFADPSTKRCVPVCPTFPDLYGQTQTFTCTSKCTYPNYANTVTRRCQLVCPTNFYKLNTSQLCVGTCPTSPDLYGDSNSGFCQLLCTSGYRYPTLRKCVTSCSAYGLFTYNFTCIKYCPYGYYANTSGICVSTCTGGTFGQNTTTQCVSTCITGYAQVNLCVQLCNDGLWGQNHICKTSCTSPARASNLTNMCVSNCSIGQYLYNGFCQNTCSTGYADPNTNLCSSGCTGGLYGDPTTHKCVSECPVNYFKDISGYCKNNCNPKLADNLTWTCTTICSNGTWGYNFQCLNSCPFGYFSYIVDRNCYNLTNQPASGLFADNLTQSWVSICPLNPLTFGDTIDNICVSVCQNNQFADPSTRKCQTNCQNSSYYADLTTNTCVLVCPNGYYGNPGNNICEDVCTLNRYAQDISHLCVTVCDSPFYGHDNSTAKVCVETCPTNFYGLGRLCTSSCAAASLYADPITNMCVDTCVGLYASDDSSQCQSSCAAYSTIADNSTFKCVSQCPSDPDLYKLGNVCVESCTVGLYADPSSGVRQCKLSCSNGLYAQPESQRCLSSCKPGYFGRNLTHTCETSCLLGTYADNATGFCQSSCTAPTVGDSLTHKCQKICTGNQFAQGGFCVSKCNSSNYADLLKRTCGTTCPSFGYVFAQNTTRSCVTNCSIVANSYADIHVRTCVLNCTMLYQYALDGQGICTTLCPSGLFMDNSTKKCQSTCALGFAQKTSRFCVTRCFGNPQTFGYVDANGVHTCQYYCLNLTSTPPLFYADNSTNLCVTTCPTSPPMFSDPISGNCVLFCPQGLFSQTIDRTCTSSCPYGFADNSTRSCVADCPSTTEETFGFITNKTCLRICPQNLFARNDTYLCVASVDCHVDTWADNISKYCVSRCPTNPLTFGYNLTKQCLPQCPVTGDLYGDFVSQSCIPTCGLRNGKQTYADPVSRTCVFRCPISSNLYADTLNNNRCTDVCSSNQLRDNSTQMCVATCPSNPDYYADTVSKYCVRTCPNGTFASDSTLRVCDTRCDTHNLTFGDNTTNRCTPKCPFPYFADNSTYLCVLICPDTSLYYGDPSSRICVKNCPSGTGWITFADDISQQCVTKCPLNYYAQNSSGKCTDRCPTDQYADQSIRVCVQNCTVMPGFYKQITNRTCVSQCPTTPVMSYKYNVNHSCVYSNNGQSGCPDSYYANPLNNMCTTFCPFGYYAQDSSKMCVQGCSMSQFADPVDRKCKTSCTLTPQYFAYDIDRVCVQYCPSPYFNDNQTQTCVTYCSLDPIMYRYQVTRQCVFNCPSPYYAFLDNQTCLLSCPSPTFAQDSTRQCVLNCLPPLFADDSTNRCVQVCPTDPDYYGINNICSDTCPNNTYRDYSTRLCVTQCPFQPLLFSDNTTNTCVKVCPSSANYFADNITGQCVLNCSSGFFAETTTRTCVQNCPSDLDTYADPLTGVCQPICTDIYFASDLTKQCVTNCPSEPVFTYAHSNKCLKTCPQGFYGQNSTLTCVTNCTITLASYADDNLNMCVSTCSVGYYADNQTSMCSRFCSQGYYADSTTRQCVLICPSTERLFSDNSTWSCVAQCPSGSYGDTLTWMCIPNCVSNITAFKLQISNLCVQQCPSPYFGFTSTKLCVTNCGNGLFGDDVTRTCVACPSTCPTCLSSRECLSCSSGLYLSYGSCVSICILNNQVANYANNVTNSCVIATKCQNGYFGNNGTVKCEPSCSSQMYGNTTTRTCENCPQYCLTCVNSTVCNTCTAQAYYSVSDRYCYAYCDPILKLFYGTTCVQNCPNGTYIDYTGITCQKCNDICLTCSGNALNCTQCNATFRYQGKCVRQCPQNYYVSNQECLPCNSTVQSCANPLTFNVMQTTQNYQPVLIVMFNQNVTVTGDPTRFIKIKVVVNRLLQGSSNLINNGVTFSAVVLPDGTIKLLLAPGMSLQNVQFQVVFTDTSSISTSSGQSLQQLQSTIQIQNSQVYATSQLMNTPFNIVAETLSILILIPVFVLLIFSPKIVFLSIQAFQLISLFGFVENLPPNLFYFLKELRINRFTFLPSIFSSVYVQPTTFNENIPTKITQIDEKLSYAVNAGGFFILFIIYLLMSLIVYVFTTKLNSNRPLKNMFIKIWNQRIKYGLIHDFAWLLSINIFLCAFMQFYFTQNGGDTALGFIIMIATIFLIILLYYQLRKSFNTQDQQAKKSLSSLMEGLKQQSPQRFFIFVYYLRKLLFTILLVATMNQGFIQVVLLLILSCIMVISLIAIRPYRDNFRNFIHFANQFGIGFICCALLYFIDLIENGAAAGTKITCGLVIICVITFHLLIAIIWAYFRTYNYLKDLYKQFNQTEFYKLYMDQQFDQDLQKDIISLNDEKGEVQSVQITNYHPDQNENQEDEIIKLKIKRKRKKINPETQQKLKDKELEKQKLNSIKKKRNEGYIKINQQNQKQFELSLPNILKTTNAKKIEPQYEKLQFSQISSNKDEEAPFKENTKYDNDWVAMKQKVEQPKKQQQVNKPNDQIFQQEGYEEPINSLIDQLGWQSNNETLMKQGIKIASQFNQQKPEQEQNILIDHELKNKQQVDQLQNKKQGNQFEWVSEINEQVKIQTSDKKDFKQNKMQQQSKSIQNKQQISEIDKNEQNYSEMHYDQLLQSQKQSIKAQIQHQQRQNLQSQLNDSQSNKNKVVQNQQNNQKVPVIIQFDDQAISQQQQKKDTIKIQKKSHWLDIQDLINEQEKKQSQNKKLKMMIFEEDLDEEEGN